MPTNTQRFGLRPAFLLLVFFCIGAESKCLEHCDLALASYYVWEGTTLTNISQYFETSIERIQSFNPNLTNKDIIHIGSRINIPFPCGCLDKQFLGHKFSYQIKSEDTYGKVAKKYYANLTTVEWLEADNIYSENRIPDVDTRILVPVNCSCGDRKVSKDFGLFVTYPLQPGESLSSIANDSGVSQEWLQRYNPDKNFTSGSGLVFIPGRDQNGTFPRLHISKAGVAGALLLVFGIYTGLYRRKKYIEASLLTEGSEDHNLQHGNGSPVNLDKSSESAALVASPGLTGISVGRSVQFTYEELAKATNDFSMGNKIGQGGFGAVFYAELRGEKAAIKKMDMRASKEFLAELKVLTHVHHVNLVRLIGYCVQGSLFLVYEFIENGNLSQHLRGSGRDPLPWSTRVQIALDSARGLQYIHEHTVPVYIHRDIKSANILIDKNFHGKVADFGLTKLTEIGGASLYTSPVGTFGYMPPEYAFGEVSPKIDVYAFGVVLYELISGKEAIIRTNETNIESKGLVALFEDVLSNPDPIEGLHKLVDPRLGDNYPFESVHKMAWIARACTQGKALQRPSMRSVVVALTMLSSATEDLDVGSLYENQVLVNLMSGK